MTVKISASTGFERVAIAVSKQEAQAINSRDLTWELMSEEEWFDRHEPCGHGPVDLAMFNVSVNGGRKQKLTGWRREYLDWPETETTWVEVVSCNEGKYHISFSIDEEFDPSKLTMFFDHVLGKDFGILSHVTYRTNDGGTIEATCDDFEDQGLSVVTRIHNAGL